MCGVGELGKNLSPSEHRSGRNREYVHEYASKWKIRFHSKETFMEDILINFTRFVNFLMLCEIIAELALVPKFVVCFRMIGVWRNSGNREPANFGILTSLGSGISTGDDFHEGSFRGQGKAKSKMSPQKFRFDV
jgi:hypothetical protein